MSDGLLALKFLKRTIMPMRTNSEATSNRLKALLLRDGAAEDLVEVYFRQLEAICCKFARLIGVRRGVTLDYRGQRRLEQFVVVVSNFWFDATGNEPSEPGPSTPDNENDLNGKCAYDTIFEMVDQMVVSLLPRAAEPSPEAGRVWA